MMMDGDFDPAQHIEWLQDALVASERLKVRKAEALLRYKREVGQATAEFMAATRPMRLAKGLKLPRKAPR